MTKTQIWNRSVAGRAARKRWKDKNPFYHKEYNTKHEVQFREYRRKWKKVHPDKVSEDRARRRAMLRKATIGGMRAIGRIYERCAWWRQWFDVVVDHILPLAKGGSHSAKNLQIIYAFENCSKKDSLTYKPSVVFN